nr:hypothetical protein [Tanacetum cinerariifolium]
MTDLFQYFEDLERLISQRNQGEPSLLFHFEEINMDPNNNQGPPLAGPIPQNSAPDLRTMEELCQLTMNSQGTASCGFYSSKSGSRSPNDGGSVPTMNGQGEPIAPVNIQATDFRLKNHMIQQVNRAVNAMVYQVTRDSIHSWEEMVTKFLSKYFPPSMVTKLRNDISNFRQLLDESLVEAWEHYKFLIDRPQGELPSNTIPKPREDIKVITTWSGITLAGLSVPPPNSSSSITEVERGLETTMDQRIPSDESKVHIEVLLVLWGNKLSFPDGSFLLTQKFKDHRTRNLAIIKSTWMTRRCHMATRGFHMADTLMSHGDTWLTYGCHVALTVDMLTSAMMCQVGPTF